MADLTKPVTLADLEAASKLVWVYCNAYGRERDVLPGNLGLPVDTPVPEAGNRLVCSAPAGQNVGVRLCNRGRRRRAGRAVASD